MDGMCGSSRTAPGKDDGLSSEREAEKAAFLTAAGLGTARREPLTGDASTRRYERLHVFHAQARLPPGQAGMQGGELGLLGLRRAECGAQKKMKGQL